MLLLHDFSPVLSHCISFSHHWVVIGGLKLQNGKYLVPRFGTDVVLLTRQKLNCKLTDLCYKGLLVIFQPPHVIEHYEQFYILYVVVIRHVGNRSVDRTEQGVELLAGLRIHL